MDLDIRVIVGTDAGDKMLDNRVAKTIKDDNEYTVIVHSLIKTDRVLPIIQHELGHLIAAELRAEEAARIDRATRAAANPSKSDTIPPTEWTRDWQTEADDLRHSLLEAARQQADLDRINRETINNQRTPGVRSWRMGWATKVPPMSFTRNPDYCARTEETPSLGWRENVGQRWQDWADLARFTVADKLRKLANRLEG